MLFLVQRLLATTAPAGFVNGKDSMIVDAESAADAIVAAQTYTQLNEGSWVGATATQLTGRADMTGVELRAVVPNTSGVAQTYSYTGVAGDTLLAAVTALTAVMNADTTTFPSGVTSSGLVITIASGNNLGAQKIASGIYVSPPNSMPNLPGIVQPTLVQTGIKMPGAAAISGQVPGIAPYNQYAPTVSAVTTAASARTITFAYGPLAGYRLRLTVADPTNPIDFSAYFGDGETLDILGARFVTLLNALSSSIVTHATYTAGTNTLLIPGATDAQGAKAITCTITSPDGVAQVSLQPTITAPGVSSIDRNIVFAADAVLPLPRIPVLNVAAACQGFVTG